MILFNRGRPGRSAAPADSSQAGGLESADARHTTQTRSGKKGRFPSKSRSLGITHARRLLACGARAGVCRLFGKLLVGDRCETSRKLATRARERGFSAQATTRSFPSLHSLSPPSNHKINARNIAPHDARLARVGQCVQHRRCRAETESWASPPKLHNGGHHATRRLHLGG